MNKRREWQCGKERQTTIEQRRRHRNEDRQTYRAPSELYDYHHLSRLELVTTASSDCEPVTSALITTCTCVPSCTFIPFPPVLMQTKLQITSPRTAGASSSWERRSDRRQLTCNISCIDQWRSRGGLAISYRGLLTKCEAIETKTSVTKRKTSLKNYIHIIFCQLKLKY